MGATVNRTRKSGTGSTNRMQQVHSSQLGNTLPVIAPSKQLTVPFASDAKVSRTGNLDSTMSKEALLSASWDMSRSSMMNRSLAGSMPVLSDTFRWDAEAPGLPGKTKLYERTLKPLTPDDGSIQSLIDSIQYRVSQMKIGTIEKLFLHLDSNRNASIKRSEIRDLLRMLNEHPSEEQFEKFYRFMDIKNVGSIDYTAFCKALCLPVEKSTDETLAEARGLTSTHNSQVPRRKNIRPPYNIDGKMHGSGLSYEEGDVSRDLPPLVSDVGNAKRKKLGRQHSVRAGACGTGRNLMAHAGTGDLTEIIRNRVHQDGHNLLSWFRWLGTGVPSGKQVMDNLEFASLLEDRLQIEVSPDQVQEMAEDLGIAGPDGTGVDINALNDQIGPRSVVGVVDADDRSNLAQDGLESPSILYNKSDRRSLRSLKSFRGGLADTAQVEAVLVELAAQIQSGPSGVSHARMLREFRLMDPKGTGQLDMDDFLGVLSKVMSRTAMKDLGMEHLRSLAKSSAVNYSTFIRSCMDMGAAYAANKGAAVTTLGRYSLKDRVGQHSMDQSDTTASKSGAVSPAHSMANTEKSGRTVKTTGTGMFHDKTNQRVSGYSWCDPRVDQIYQNTDHVTVPSEECSHYQDDFNRLRTKKEQIGKDEANPFSSPCNRSLHAPKGKLQRLQDDRSRAEQAVLKEDSRAGLRQAGRLRLYAEQMQAYNNNLQMDDRSTARWIADVHPQARYQASGDLLKQSLLIIQQKAAVDAERKRQTAESETLPTKPRGPLQQYSRLPFVGR